MKNIYKVTVVGGILICFSIFVFNMGIKTGFKINENSNERNFQELMYILKNIKNEDSERFDEIISKGYSMHQDGGINRYIEQILN